MTSTEEAKLRQRHGKGCISKDGELEQGMHRRKTEWKLIDISAVAIAHTHLVYLGTQG